MRGKRKTRSPCFSVIILWMAPRSLVIFCSRCFSSDCGFMICGQSPTNSAFKAVLWEDGRSAPPCSWLRPWLPPSRLPPRLSLPVGQEGPLGSRASRRYGSALASQTGLTGLRTSMPPVSAIASTNPSASGTITPPTSRQLPFSSISIVSCACNGRRQLRVSRSFV